MLTKYKWIGMILLANICITGVCSGIQYCVLDGEHHELYTDNPDNPDSIRDSVSPYYEYLAYHKGGTNLHSTWISSTDPFAGNRSIAYEILTNHIYAVGDPNDPDPDNRYMDKINHVITTDAPRVAFGETNFFGFAVRLGQLGTGKYFAIPLDFLLIHQWKQSWPTGDAGPMFHMDIVANGTSTTNVKARFRASNDVTFGSEIGCLIAETQINLGEWYTFTVEMNARHLDVDSGPGYVKIYQGDAQIGYWKGHIGYNPCFTNTEGINICVGPYRTRQNVRHRVFFDNMKYATDYTNAHPSGHAKPNDMVYSAPADPIHIEAENGHATAPMIRCATNEASAGYYVGVPDGIGNDGDGRIDFYFQTNPDAIGWNEYVFYINVKAPGDGSNSIKYQIDDGEIYDLSFPASGNYVWHQIHDRTEAGIIKGNGDVLSPGSHKFTIWNREDGTRIDKIAICNSRTYPDIYDEEAENGRFTLEAENGEIQSPMVIANSTNASAGYYIYVPNGSAGGGKATYRIDVKTNGNYRIKALAASQVAGGNDDSIWIALDGVQLEQFWDFPGTTTFAWDTYDETIQLNSGAHTIELIQREDGLMIDALVIEKE